MTQQYYRLMLSEAITHYKDGLITAPGLLYYYLKIRLAPGWKCTLHQREITEKLGISRAAFYKAITKLSELGLLEFEAPNGLTVTLSPNRDTNLRLETPVSKWRLPVYDWRLKLKQKPHQSKRPAFLQILIKYLSTLSQIARERIF